MTALATIVEALFERYRYPDWLRRHSAVVATVAQRLAVAHAERGAPIDADRVTLGAYLHDIGRSPLLRGDGREHHLLGPLVLAAEGLADLAELSRRHPVYAPRDPTLAPRTLEEKIVYYADRRGGQAVVSLEDRVDEQLARYPRAEGDRAADLAAARAIERELFDGLAFGPDAL